MTDFSWTNPVGGDWSVATNWVIVPGNGLGPPPPGPGDSAAFADLASAYTVTVLAGTKAGGLGTSLSINATSLTKDVAFDISGTLTGNFTYGTNTGDPTTSLVIEPGGSLIVPVLLFSIDVFETVTISGMGAGGYLELGTPDTGGFVSGKNSLMVLDFANTGATTLNTGVIQLDGFTDLSVHAAQTITNVAAGDAIVIKGADFTGDTVTLNTATNTLTVMNGPTTVFTMDDVVLQAGAANSFAIVNGETIQAQIACFARGTMIHTPAGEVAVETLSTGTRVIALINGERVPRTVRWVGHRRIDLTRHPRPDTVAPIRVERDAFAENVPHRDLLLSPDHAIFTHGMLICVGQLVNGATIRRETGWSAVDYYHVELNEHAILLAEGLPAESYLDTGNRGFFANAAAPLLLHPDLPNAAGSPTREAGSCARFVTGEAGVRPVWQRLAERAAAIGRAVPARITTTDAAPRLQGSDGRTFAPLHSDSDRVIFALPRGASEVWLVSRAQTPGEARPWLADPRRLGMRVRRIVLRGVDAVREVAMDGADFARGWWEIEHDGPVMSRWTDGGAVLPLPPMRGPVLLEIHLAGAMTYVEDASNLLTIGQEHAPGYANGTPAGFAHTRKPASHARPAV